MCTAATYKTADFYFGRTMNFPMGMKWQSCHGIMHLPSGIWVH